MHGNITLVPGLCCVVQSAQLSCFIYDTYAHICACARQLAVFTVRLRRNSCDGCASRCRLPDVIRDMLDLPQCGIAPFSVAGVSRLRMCVSYRVGLAPALARLASSTDRVIHSHCPSRNSLLALCPASRYHTAVTSTKRRLCVTQ